MAYAAATSARDAKRSPGELLSLKMSNVAIYKGGLVAILAADGYATHTPTTDSVFAGVAAESVNNSAGNAGDKSIKVYVEGVFEFTKASAVQADVGDYAYWDTGTSGNNYTVVTSAPTVDIIVGRIVEVVDSSTVRVCITGYALRSADS